MNKYSILSKELKAYIKKINTIDINKNDMCLFKRISSSGSLTIVYSNMYGRYEVVKKEVFDKYFGDIGIKREDLPDYYDYKRKIKPHLEYVNSLFYSTRGDIRKKIYINKQNTLLPTYRDRRDLYDEYISSPEWAAKRQECFQHHGSLCADCLYDEATDIHHKHYDTLGDECPKNDIVPLCNGCHRRRHDRNSLMKKPEEV